MTLKEKLAWGAGVLVVGLVAQFLFGMIFKMPAPNVAGALTQQLIEQYDPYVRYAGGIRTALPIVTSSTFTDTGAASFTGTAQIGSNGTAVANFLIGSCSLIMPSFTVAASSSVAADCAVTGLTSNDKFHAWFATSSSNGAGWLVTQSSASSTSAFGTMRIVNNTGASAVIPASIASSTNFIAGH